MQAALIAMKNSNLANYTVKAFCAMGRGLGKAFFFFFLRNSKEKGTKQGK